IRYYCTSRGLLYVYKRHGNPGERIIISPFFTFLDSFSPPNMEKAWGEVLKRISGTGGVKGKLFPSSMRNVFTS
ncbi:MAG: hypothetical protein LUE98_20375, partial [Tannerellaceae bacterium]|nr:hypothetical protein [Tannerellaceae bacterium]